MKKEKVLYSNENIMFSIVCPTYNSELFIADCIRSVVNQTFNGWELLLVDDGSTDKSGKICDDFSKKDPRIKSFHKKNEGQYLAREYGVERSAGNYIIFLDSDDFYESYALNKLYKIIQDTTPDIILFGLNKYKVDGSKAKMHEDGLFNGRGESKKEVIRFCFTGPMSNISLCSYCFKKSLFLKIGNPPIKKTIKSHEDVLLLFELAKVSNNIISIDSCLYNYRDNYQSVTHHLKASDYLDAIEVSDYIFSSIEKDFNIKRGEIDKRIISRLAWLPLSYIVMSYFEYSTNRIKKETRRVAKNYIYKKYTRHYKFKSMLYKTILLLFRLKLDKINCKLIKKHIKM